jgi:hypothetical protein
MSVTLKPNYSTPSVAVRVAGNEVSSSDDGDKVFEFIVESGDEFEISVTDLATGIERLYAPKNQGQGQGKK